ncbi:serine-rich adhesin for platelets [Sabethes cyaneus]|uniref:serine-rich adhesin for platelets n=1 Tax=Sabethes cyaneus TaxID=53552 RepID=UPI00237E9F05|nr:serine-rich adhesin for platelets [Sabethes cyaneus]XP_053689290.1 serine-rich adhesin for platelets [Sabethes cyaneus]XP_053689301.1 serine-rich adhesin for platelets [Sabethes cyaneus]XP_053689310.1 serine-rich adhesin for platelets [Sabethes cyaneus]
MADYCHSGGSSTVSSSTGSCLSSFRPPPVAMGGYPHHRLHHHHGGSHPSLLRTSTATTTTTTATGGDGVRSHSVSVTTAAAAAKALGTMVIDHRVRIVRLNRPPQHSTVGHSHHNGSSSSNFGFSVRGGLEYGTGFFVSAVESDSEAERQGLKVGDQIVRVNGYHVDDAVHRELTHFVTNQERLVLKVRSVGIIPVKERSVDSLTWHVVSFNGASVVSSSSNASSLPRVERTSCGSSTTSSTGSGGTAEELPTTTTTTTTTTAGSSRELKITLSVPPRTKLGCGICKGPDWRPGIFVQFTKEGGVAREAGLRPGDQIMSCNGREFADITFAEAVSIMKASSLLELMVRPGAGIDMFPGESSGYNSSASSVNGDSSPCWGESAAKRLSIVREESISKDRRGKLGTKGVTNGRRNNTTIIEFSENGTVINNSNSLDKKQSNGENNSTAKGESKKLADICFVSKQSETKTIIVEVHRSASANSIHTGSPPSAGSASHIPPPPPLFADKIPPPPPPNSCGLSSGYSTTNSAKSSSVSSSNSNNRQQQRSPSAVSLADSSASSGIDCGGGLGNAISEELKRRAQKKGTSLSSALEPAAALTELENRLKEKRFRPPNSGGSDAARHSALMDEFKAVHKRMFKNGFDNAELKKSPSKDKLPTDGVAPPPAVAAGAGSTTAATKGTMGRVAATELAKANGDVAELESIESFKMTNPTPTPVRPPSYYFCPQNTGPPTMKKTLKPIAVTISEYEPSKSGNRFDTFTESSDASCSIGRLRSELEKTLSMSNLRLRCESRENLAERGHPAPLDGHAKLNRSSSVANGVGRVGFCQLPVASSGLSSGNRITISISGSAAERK